MWYVKRTHISMTLVVSKKNTHAMTLLDPCVVSEENTHAMTPVVVSKKKHTCNDTSGSICGMRKQHTFQ